MAPRRDAWGAWNKPEVKYLGAHAREATRRARLTALGEEIAAVQTQEHACDQQRQTIVTQTETLDRESAALPKADDYLRAMERAHAAADHGEAAAQTLEGAQHEHCRYLDGQAQRDRELDACAITHGLQGWVDRLSALRELTEEYVLGLGELRAQADDHGRAQTDVQQQRLKRAECAEHTAADEEDRLLAAAKTQQTRSSRDALQATLGATPAALQAEIERLGVALRSAQTTEPRERKRHDTLLADVAAGRVHIQTFTEQVQAREGARQQAKEQLTSALREDLAVVVLEGEPLAIGETPSYTDVLLQARTLDARFGELDCSANARDAADNRVVQRQQELTRSLSAHTCACRRSAAAGFWYIRWSCRSGPTV